MQRLIVFNELMGEYQMNQSAELGKSIGTKEIFRKLYEYEEAGLEPEDVAVLARAKAEGRLVVLPCKVGDTIYEGYPEGIDQAVVDEILIGIWTKMGVYEPSDFEKTVFLTREAAEQALGGRKNER